MHVLTAKEMKAAEARTLSCGLPAMVLMENAAAALEREVLEKNSKGPIAVVCGSGNNGGDGLALARRLFLKGYNVFALCPLGEERFKNEALIQYRLFKRAGGTVLSGSNYAQCPPCEIYVDALLGTGLSRPVEGEAEKTIIWINEQKGTVIAADLPSGVCCDTGKILGRAVKADMTVTFGFGKLGLYLYPGRAHAGQVKVADIGLLPFQQGAVEVLTERDILALWPERKGDSHKGTYGKGLIFAGSKGFAGAGELCAKGALRAGIGLLTLCIPDILWPIYQKTIPQAMTFSLAEKDGAYEGSDVHKIAPLIDKADALAIGPGITVREGSRRILTYILESRRIPIVIDADGLNLLAREKSPNLAARGEAVLTPHPGEMARLMGKPLSGILENPLDIARAYAAQTGAVVVLKGSTSVIAAPDGRVTFNVTGNPGMAKGGSGDVLTGIILALLGQGLSGYDAARVGCYIHGKAGDLAAVKAGFSAMSPGDVADFLREVLVKLNR